MKTVNYHHTSQHGYLAVPCELILKAGIQENISGYSYMSVSGRTVYLEEDCDAGLFADACKAKGIDYQLVHILPSKLNLNRLQGYLWK
jgi:hypothetical protein